VDESGITRLPVLKRLQHDDVVALATEVLGADWSAYAERLAQVSFDSPFITVVGGRLIARGSITPELLNNDAEFQRRVYDSLASQYEGLLPSGRCTKREFMEFIAALQPVREGDDSFIAKSATFLDLKDSQVRRGFTSLEENGVLTRARKGSSVIPDMLADYLLGLASVERDGEPTEFADEVYDSFHGSHLSSLLKNLAELEWRITHRDNGSRLLDKIWAKICSRFRAENASERMRTLRDMEGVTAFLPTRIHSLIQIAMDEPAATANIYGLYRVDHQRVLQMIPAFLGVTILDETSSRDAFDRLWKLAQHESEDVNRLARNTLKGAIGYRKYKELIFNERILTIVEDLAKDPGAYDGTFTPLDILDELMAREIDHTEQVGRAFQVSVLVIAHQNVRALRDRALRAFESALDSESHRIAFRAAKSLSKIVSIFIPMRRDRETEEERSWQDEERMRALNIIQARLDRGNPPLQPYWKIRRVLQSASTEARQSELIRGRASEMLASLTTPDLFDVFDVLCTEQWEQNTDADIPGITSSRRRELEAQAISSLVVHHPEPTEQVRTIESLVQAALDAGIQVVSIDSFLTELCRDRRFLLAFSEHLLHEGKSLLRQVAGIAIRAWRSTDKQMFLHFGTAFANLQHTAMVVSVASEVCSGPAVQNATAEDLEIISILAARKEPWVIGTILQGLGHLSKPGPFSREARNLLLRVDIGKHSDLAERYCQIVGNGPFSVAAAALDSGTIRGMLEKLVPVYELDGPFFGQFISHLAGRTPLGIAALFEARLALAESITPDDQEPLYKPIPNSNQWSTLSDSRQSPDYEGTVRKFFDLGRQYPDDTVYLDQLFWRFGTTDDMTFSILDEGLHAVDVEVFRRTIQLLCDAPKGIAFSHPLFALHLLVECEKRSEEWGNTAMDLLVSNSVSPGGFQAMGPYATPIGSGVAERAQACLERCDPGSPLHRLYSRLAGIVPIPLPDFAAQFESDEDE
jgi:hypothetical protein